MNTDTDNLDAISVDYTTWGIVVSTLVEDNYGNRRLHQRQIIPQDECSSEWHTPGECECTPDDDHRREYLDYLTRNGYRLVTWQEMEN